MIIWMMVMVMMMMMMMIKGNHYDDNSHIEYNDNNDDDDDDDDDGDDGGDDDDDNNNNKTGTNANKNKCAHVLHCFLQSFLYPHPGPVGLDWDTLYKTLNPEFDWEGAVQKALGSDDTLEEVLLPSKT